MQDIDDEPGWNVMFRDCPSRVSLARIANKWTAMIVIALAEGPLRFSVLKDKVEGISSKVLTETLRDLERDGMVLRRAWAQVPPRVDYELTALGASLIEPLGALRHWAENHTTEVLRARRDYDSRRDQRPDRCNEHDERQAPPPTRA